MTSTLHPGTVTRTRRHAVKVGDEYITLEETITLPLNTEPLEIQAAVQLGVQINAAQEAAFAPLLEALRQQALAAPESDEPASDKQRGYLQYLLTQVGWNDERLTAFAAERDLDLLTLTKAQCSALIDDLKQINNGGLPSQPTVAQPAAAQPAYRPDIPEEERATHRQLKALERAAEDGRLDSAAALRRFNVRELRLISMDEAGCLLSESQQKKAPAAQSQPAQPAPTTRQPDPQRVHTARAALATAEQRAQHLAPSGRIVPHAAPTNGATSGQLGKIAGQMHELRQVGAEESDLDEVGHRFGIERLSQLRKSEQLQALGLTKVDAGHLIDALKVALTEFGVPQA
ncbi:MAG: hypothetical protein M3R24_12720 [Chloroflexota bacterium]|nr:hypothetical protein [Chloroflexota bacterium]